MSNKILLSKGCEGFLVKNLQNALKSEGFQLVADGDFGGKTESALVEYQKSKGVAEPVPGVTSGLWQEIVKTPTPTLYDRCLMLTSNIEGHGYKLAAGNWDRAGVTWGIIGFTISSGSLFEVLKRIPNADLVNVFGQVRAHQLVSAARSKNLEFANSISMKPKKTKLIETWHNSFLELGDIPSAVAAQNEVAKIMYWEPAMKQLAQFSDLKSERAAALYFDCRVQQGQVYKSSVLAAQSVLSSKGNETKALEAIAQWQRDGMNEGARASFGENVYSRKILMAKGFGTANGREYVLSTYGLTMDPR